MNEHAGAASALSVLIVGLFAILLHDRQPSPPPRPPMADSSPAPRKSSSPIASTESGKSVSKAGKPAAVKPVLAPDPGRVVTRSPEISAPLAAPLPKPAPPAPPVKKLASSVARLAPEAAQKGTSTPSKPSTPKAPFTVVRNGEDLVAVANRVYGSSSAAEGLWKANRDQVNSIDSPLRRGTLLRTP